MAETAVSNTPQSLNSWREHLRQLTLPADPQVKAAALQKLKSSTGNANNVANIVQDDPALSVLLIHEANKSLAASGGETQSLAHTISLLGFPRTETLIRRAPKYDRSQFPQLAEYRQQLTISLHAAYQAQTWAQLNPHWQHPNIFWATLLQQAPVWALWYHAGEQMQQIQALRVKHRGARHNLIEQQLLGTSILALSTALAREWYLPELSQLSLQAGHRGSARQWLRLSKLIPEPTSIAVETYPELQKVCSNPAFLIALCHLLADECEWDWHSDRTRRLQKVLAASLNKSLDDTIALNHQQAVEASRRLPLSHGLLPAQQLISYYNKTDALKASALSEQPRPVTQSATSTTTQAIKIKAKPPGLLADAPSGFVDVIERMQQQPESFKDLHEIMKLAVSALHHHLGLERASASLLHIQNKELRSYYSSGAQDSPALKNFRHTLQRGDLFNKLLQKPLSVRLQPSNYNQIWPLLPGNFKQACGADEFFMMSIFSHKKPIGLIYADRGVTNRALNDQQYALFKQLCSAVSHCLQHPR